MLGDRNMNILNTELDVVNIADTMDADVPSPDAVYDVVDLNLDLDLNVDFDLNLAFNTSVMFDCPDFTDSILTDDFNTKECNNWNEFQEIEQFSFEENSSITNSNASNLFIFQVEPVLGSNASTNFDTTLETTPDGCDFDFFKDGSFELDLFNECFKDIQDPTHTEPTISDYESVNSSVASSVVDWNRRRSLLYDKNEFIRPASSQSSAVSRRHQETSRIKTPTLAPKNQPVEPRAFKCLVRDCEKTYCKASHLKSHMRRHSGVKPFACDSNGCKWRFSRSDELARHKRSHSGVKPYTCNLCDKAFSRSDHLSKHSKVHMKKMALYGTPIITKKCNYKYLSVNRLHVE